MTDYPRLPIRDRSREFQLFQYGPLVAFEDTASLRVVRDELRMYGYTVIDVDASSGSGATCYRQIAEAFRDPYAYDDSRIEIGSWSDLERPLRDLVRAAGTVFAVTGYDALVAADPLEAEMLDELVRAAWYQAINGRLLGVLVHPVTAVERRVAGFYPNRWYEWWPE